MQRQPSRLLPVVLLVTMLLSACGTASQQPVNPVPPVEVTREVTRIVQAAAPAAADTTAVTPVAAAACVKLDCTPRLGVLSAMEDELVTLLSETSDKKAFVVNGRTMTIGSLQGHDVVLSLSGVSMVNAAMTSQQMFDNFNVTSVVFSGIAGGVNPGLNIGDVVVRDGAVA